MLLDLITKLGLIKKAGCKRVSCQDLKTAKDSSDPSVYFRI
jgi:hypothetical protein